MGDFNMIYRATDKNNDRLNLRLMGRFCRFLNAASLKEFHLEGKLFTWSNERSHPTLERFDRAFVSWEWDELYSNCDLRSLALGCSDHAPLLLRTESVLAYRRHFHFRSYWPKLHAYLEVVQRAWSCPIPDTNPFRKLEWLLRNTFKALQSWSDRSVGNIRLQLEVVREVGHRLEMASDRRALATHEESLHKLLKCKSLGLASLQRSMVRQESRLLWLKEGDTSTKFFHSYANMRRRKKHIHSLEHNG
jgi:hypothetical protein